MASGLWPRPATHGLILKGEDRQRLLNGLVTCDVKALEVGQGVRGFFTDAKGHILSPVIVRAAEDHLWLELPHTTIDSIAEHIVKYIVVDRVEVTTTEALVPLTLTGSESIPAMERFLQGQESPVGEWGHTKINLGDSRVLVSRGQELGFPTVTFWLAESLAAEHSQAVREGIDLQESPELDDEAVEILRVESGSPRFGVDYGVDNLPQETGLEDAVSFTKGCFLGQEVVARLHYRGQVAKRVSKMEIDADANPAVGTGILLDGREAGEITSVVRSPESGRVTALAMLQRRASEPGTELSLGDGGVARVV